MSSQIGKSLLMLLIVGYHVAAAPRSMFLAQATKDTLQRFVKEKLEPLVLSSPAVGDRMHLTSHGRLPAGQIPFDGGVLFTAWAGSAASLRSASSALVLGDEVDVWQGSVDADSPIDMLRQRASAFGAQAKMVVASTPTDVDDSVIWAEYETGSGCRWMVPCPHCHHEHTLEWDNVVDNRLQCPACAGEITERQRLAAVDAGRWVPDRPDQLAHRSYHANQLMSAFRPFEATVADAEAMLPRAFRTQVLGLPYKSTLRAVREPSDLTRLHRLEPPALPSAITAAVDVQANRLELQVVHWDGLNPHVHSHQRLVRMADGDGPLWRRLDAELRRQRPDLVYIDRGYRPDDVRRWCHDHLDAWLAHDRLRFCKGWARASFDEDLNTRRGGRDRPARRERGRRHRQGDALRRGPGRHADPEPGRRAGGLSPAAGGRGAEADRARQSRGPEVGAAAGPAQRGAGLRRLQPGRAV